MSAYIGVLKNTSLFSALSDKALEAIAPKFIPKNFASGAVIFDDGSSDTDGMFVIVKGAIKIYKNISNEEDRQQAVAVLKAGSFFGEMALMDEETRSAGAMAMEDCELLFLSKESFKKIISENLETAHAILTQISKVMSKRLRDTNNLFREVVGWGYRARKEVRDLKSNFLSTISHELRTPIHSIQGFSSLMRDAGEIDKETQSKFVEVILSESKRLADLINDLIALAEMEYGAIVLERQPCNLKDIVESAAEAYKDDAGEKKIVCTMNIPAGLPMVLLDGNRMKEAVGHLFENAIKFTPYEGRVTVDVKVEPQSVDILVSDTGRGIPAKFVDRIFDKFYQVDQSNTRDVEGAGIGLTLALHIVDLHGGTISVASKEGQGSTFKISLPNEHVLVKS